jgi:hypothetical protein
MNTNGQNVKFHCKSFGLIALRYEHFVREDTGIAEWMKAVSAGELCLHYKLEASRTAFILACLDTGNILLYSSLLI